MYRPRGDIARHQISVLRIPLLQEIKSLRLRNALSRAFLPRIARNPNASAFPARRFTHQAKLVFPGDRRRMHLDEFPIRVIDALLKQRRLRRPRANHRIRRPPKNRPDSTRAKDHRIGGKSFHFHRPQIHRANAAPHARIVNHRRQKRPALPLGHLPFGFVPPHLLVQRI